MPEHGDDYIDLPHTIYINANIVKSVSSDLTSADKKIWAVNYFLSALFREIMNSFHSRLIHILTDRRIEKLLNFDTNAKSTHLQTSMWFKGTVGDVDRISENNKEFQNLYALIGLSNISELLGHIHGDILNQENF